MNKLAAIEPANELVKSPSEKYPTSEYKHFFSHYEKAQFHYLDSAATSQKPDLVIKAITRGYQHFCAPVHRTSYPQGQQASFEYEKARQVLADFINAAPEQVIFTKSATESINYVAIGWAAQRLTPERVIWVTQMEHNANYLPWRRLCQQHQAQLKIISIDTKGNLQLDNPDIWQPSTLLIAVTLCSNVLGGENPVAELCAKARLLDICVMVDAAQFVAHTPLDVMQLDCDFLTFSAHKMYGPEGIAILYARHNRLPELTPLLLGGGIVSQVNAAQITYLEAPHCFEAGSPNLSAALGFAAAAEFLQSITMATVHRYINQLGKAFKAQLAAHPGVELLPVAGNKDASSVISFNLTAVHPHDVADVAAQHNVAMRTGHHCAHLLMGHLDLAATNRISLGLYNDLNDLSALLHALTCATAIYRCERD